MKKVLCAVLSLLLLVSAVSVYALAASEEVLQESPASEEMNASDAEKTEADAAELSLDGAPGQISAFTTMDDLKTLINTMGMRQQASYSGTDTFVFDESISLPRGLSISFNSMDVEIASGVQVINNGGFFDCGELAVNGVLINTGSVSVASLTGVANVTNSGEQFVVGCTVRTAAALASVLSGVDSGVYRTKNIIAEYTLDPGAAVVLDRNITVPACATLNIGADTTISSGCTLTNNGTVLLARDISLTLADGGAYAGLGGILIRKGLGMSYVTDKTAALTRLDGFDGTKLHLDDSSSTWYYAELTELATPKNLAFDNGYATWTVDGAAENTYLVKFYLLGGEEPIASSLTTECSAFILSAELPYSGQILGEIESGEYYFTVASIGDFVSTASSPTVTYDGYWNYTKPAAKLGTCTNVSLNLPTITFTAPQDASKVLGYELRVTTSPEEAMSYGDGFTCYVTDTTASLNDVMAKYGIGYYKVEIRALSKDPGAMLSSDWSEASGVEYYGMADLLAGLADCETLPAETRTALQKAAESYAKAADNPEGKTLESILLEDEDALSDVEKIDTALGGVQVVVDSSIASEIDQTQVKIVGGAINTPVDEDTQISLEIGAAAKDNEAPDGLERALTVQFSMTMGNIEDAEALEFPVWVRLPIPKTMDTEDLVILHYHVSGDVEEVEYTLIEGDDDQYYAAFVLTDFSDFSIAGQQLTGENGQTKTDKKEKDKEPSPATGDPGMPVLWTAAVLTMGLSILLLSKKKNNG